MSDLLINLIFIKSITLLHFSRRLLFGLLLSLNQNYIQLFLLKFQQLHYFVFSLYSISSLLVIWLIC